MNLKHRLPLIAVIFTSVLCIAISVFSLKSGQFIVFQNLFYIPIIISCFYYTKKGFAISVALSCIYFLLIIAFTSDPMIIRDAVIRVCIFIFIAAVITALSMARAHAEAVLKEEREKFRTVADFTYDWEYWTDPQQKLRYISPSCERISGYRPEDFMTDSGLIHSVVHPDDRDIFKCHADHYHELHIDSVGEVNFRIMDRNGEEHWIAHVCRPVYSSDGQFLGRRASNSDITNRKQAEEALREGEHRLHSIIDGSPIPVFVIGKDHRVIYWNKALEELSSIKPEEVVGTHEHWKAFYNEERLCMADLLVDGAVELVPHRYSGKYIKSPLIEDAYEATDFFPALGKDGKWLRFTAAAIRESKGMIVAAVETLEDITERKRAEDAQFKSEERFRITLMSIGDGVITTDAEGRVDLLNPVAENLSGWSQGEARGKQLEEVFSIINEDTRQPVENPVLQVLRDGIVVGLANHTVLIARNGTERPIADSGAPILGADGAITGTVLIFRDQTEERKAQNKLEAMERRLSKIIDFLPDPTMAIDSEKRVIVWNRAMEELTGVPAAEMLGKGDYAYTIPFYGVARPQLMDLFWVPAHEITQKYPAICKDRDNLVVEVFCPALHNGKGAPVWAKAAPLCDKEGHLVGAIESIRDISERKQAEEALRESEEKYRTLIETTRDLIYTADRKGFLTYMNPTFERTLGYAHHEWNGKTFAQMVSPECIASVKDHFIRAMKGESIPVYSVDLIRKDGKVLSIEFNVVTIYDSDGNPSGRYGIGRDVTDRKQAEVRDRLAYEVLELLNRSDGSKDTVRDILQLIKKNTGFQAVGIRLREDDDFPYYDTNGFSDDFIHAERYLCARDDEGKIIRDEQGNPILDCMCGNILCGRTNPALPFFTGGGSFWSNCTTELLASTTEEDRRARTRNRCNGEGYESVALIPLRSGDEIIGLIQLNDRRRNQFTPEMIRFFEGLGASIGIALSRKQAEEALRQEQQFSKLVLDSLPGIFYLYTYPENRMILWNKQHETLLGYTTEETKDKFVTDWHLPEHKEAVLSAVEEVMKNGQSSIDGVLIAKDGHLIPFSFTGVRFEARGQLYFMGIGIDTTDRHTVEQENRSLSERLQRAEKMEALGTLAGGVAHDLNNVLGIVVGYSEMLLDGVDQSSPLRHGLENIMTGGLRAAAIVDDLLTLARRGVTGRSILNLNKIIADCQKSPEFESLSYHHPSVKIKTDIDPDLLNISGSSVHLGKSLYNLISNASEAMVKGGTVTIRTRNQYLDRPIQGYDQIREGDYVVLSVSDTGEGIQTTDLKRIFEPFYTKKVMGRSGTGLGLAVVWGTVKDHHGYINVESEEGGGSTFTLYFPVTREDITAEHVAVPVSAYMGSGESILVVDDVKEQRDLASGMLRKLNYNVASVSSGEEAVLYLKEHTVDLMLLDMIMDPGMDGLDTYRSVLDIHPKQKAIIVSGFSETDRVKTARELGSGAYVRKPYIKEKLGLAVKKELADM